MVLPKKYFELIKQTIQIGQFRNGLWISVTRPRPDGPIGQEITNVRITIQHKNLVDLEKIIEMGFQG